jgi:hypothetical protein
MKEITRALNSNGLIQSLRRDLWKGISHARSDACSMISLIIELEVIPGREAVQSGPGNIFR